MKSDYRNNIYDKYYTFHTSDLLGEINIDNIRKNFPVFSYYYKKFLPVDKDAKIIDLGCGSGDFVYWLNENGYINAHGIDVSKELIRKGVSAGINNIGIEDIFSFLEKSNEEYNLIIMRDVLEHFEKDEVMQLIGLINKTLKQDGKLILQVPNGQSPFVGRIFFGDFTHHNAFTYSSLKQIFLSAGFKNIFVKEITPVPYSLKGKLRLLLWKLLVLQMKVKQLITTGDSSGFFSPNIIAYIRK